MAPAFHRFVLSNPLTRPIARQQTEALFDTVAGFVYAQTLAAMVELDLFRRLAEAPRTTKELAADLHLSERAVDTLMSAGAARGLVDRRGERWGLGMKGAAILGQGGIAEMVSHHHHFYRDLADPVARLRQDGPTELAGYWTYSGGERTARFDAEGYTSLMAASQAFIASAVLHNAPFRKARHLTDLGGGAGAFAMAALKCHKNLTVTVLDRADVIPHAQAALSAAGFGHRATVGEVDFFKDDIFSQESPGPTDLVSLVRILHDHDDEAVAALLKNVARQIGPARLVVVEPMANHRRPTGLDAYFPWYFNAMGQGRFRSPQALTAFLKEAGFHSVTPLHSRNPTLTKVLLASVQFD
ncbi:MAG: methyltransferase [Pseudomonadota bacterium]